MQGSEVISLAKETFQDWGEDKAGRLSAALAYYAVFSIPPLLLLILVLAGRLLGTEFTEQQLQTRLIDQFGGLLGQDGADLIATTIENASQPGESLVAATLSFVVLLFGAAGLFGQLQDAMNTIWEVAPKPNRGILGTLKDRFFSFTLVLGVAFLLLISLVLSAALAALDEFLLGLAPDAEIVIRAVNFLISFAVVTVLFALLFKVIPDVHIAWNDVWVGAAVTAVLFTVGKWVISLYLGNSAPASTYGAAGSLVILLLWIYYSSNILFLGAEFTQVYANKYGSRIVADESAVPLTEERRVQQGIPSQEAKDAAERQEQAPAPQPASGIAMGARAQDRSYPQAQEMQPQPVQEDENRSFLYYVVAVLTVLMSVRRFIRER